MCRDEYIREAAPDHAEKWLIGLFKAILTLEAQPLRCPLIAEAKQVGYPVRHLLYGQPSSIHRIIFSVHEEEQHVRVLRVWHASRDVITAADLQEWAQ